MRSLPVLLFSPYLSSSFPINPFSSRPRIYECPCFFFSSFFFSPGLFSFWYPCERETNFFPLSLFQLFFFPPPPRPQRSCFPPFVFAKNLFWFILDPPFLPLSSCSLGLVYSGPALHRAPPWLTSVSFPRWFFENRSFHPGLPPPITPPQVAFA